ncbi:coadhesin-like [Ruditapes philippinarum]|uniref:coadhesin-like n=1 Tax=Ruditapes philippinarum TaxID=129788 RepID=UPI00295B2D1A|nr:coadhesin-like [Ruditapes philippinarum]
MDIKHTAGSTSFSLGCKDNQMCGKPSYSAGELIIGRDLNKRETNECAECCGINNCNKNLCTHSKPSACIDDSKTDCAYLNTLFNICQDIHHGKTVCAKFCNLCSLVDGNWAEWSLWSNCNGTCDRSIRFRERACSNPAPIHGGLHCTVNSKKRETCSMPLCPAGTPSVISQSKDVTTLTYSDGDRLIFAKTISNDGNGYGNGTGIFTAPIAGT